MSMGRTLSIGGILRFLPALAIVGVWCLLSINPDIDLLSFLMFQTILIALFLVFSSYALEDGTPSLGFGGLAIGLGMHFGSIYLGISLSPAILVMYYIQVAIAIMNVLGAAISLFGAIALGLWLARDRFEPGSHEVKYGAPLLGFIVVVIWIVAATFTLSSPTLIIAALEIIFYVLLIIVSCIFIPRRQFITIFYFILGLILALWGLLNLGPEISISYFLLGYYFRVLGVALVSLFAVPLAVSSIYEDRHPESPLYMIATLWFFGSFFIPGLSILLSPLRVAAIAAILYISMKNLKPKLSLFIVFGIVIGFINPVVEANLWILVILGSAFYLTPLVLTLSIVTVGTTFFIFSILSLGEILRTRLGPNKTNTRLLGVVLIVLGLAIGLFTMIIDISLLSILDPVVLLLVGLGSMLIVIKPGKAMYSGASLGFAMATLVLVDYMFRFGSLTSLQWFFYPSLVLMIFCSIQQSRASSKWLEKRMTRRKKKVVPMEISPESVLQSGLYTPKKKAEVPEPTVDPPEPVPSPDLESDTLVSEPIVAEEPVSEEKDEQPEPIEVEVSENAIATVQQRIPEGESLPDDQRMARNWYNRAFGFLDIGDLEAALKALETALKWQPDHTQALALKKELQEK